MKTRVEFKDPDFIYNLRLPKEVETKLRKLSAFGEYWTIELDISDDGLITEAHFIKSEP